MNQVKSNSNNQQDNALTDQTAKNCRRKLLIKILIILFVEAPQIISAWISIAEKMPLFHNHHFPPIEVIQHLVK